MTPESVYREVLEETGDHKQAKQAEIDTKLDLFVGSLSGIELGQQSDWQAN